MAGASLSTHVLDTHAGRPAQGVAVTLSRVDGDRLTPVAEGRTDRDGRILRLADGLAPGPYRLAFEVGRYFAGAGEAPLFARVSFDLDLVAGHYHVPLLASRFACVTYRGS